MPTIITSHPGEDQQDFPSEDKASIELSEKRARLRKVTELAELASNLDQKNVAPEHIGDLDVAAKKRLEELSAALKQGIVPPLYLLPPADQKQKYRNLTLIRIALKHDPDLATRLPDWVYAASDDIALAAIRQDLSFMRKSSERITKNPDTLFSILKSIPYSHERTQRAFLQEFFSAQWFETKSQLAKELYTTFPHLRDLLPPAIRQQYDQNRKEALDILNARLTNLNNLPVTDYRNLLDAYHELHIRPWERRLSQAEKNIVAASGILNLRFVCDNNLIALVSPHNLDLKLSSGSWLIEINGYWYQAIGSSDSVIFLMPSSKRIGVNIKRFIAPLKIESLDQLDQRIHQMKLIIQRSVGRML